LPNPHAVSIVVEYFAVFDVALQGFLRGDGGHDFSLWCCIAFYKPSIRPPADSMATAACAPRDRPM